MCIKLLFLFFINSTPDDEKDLLIFDYYVDEAGEWDQWNAKLEESLQPIQTDPFGYTIIETFETVCSSAAVYDFVCFESLSFQTSAILHWRS